MDLKRLDNSCDTAELLKEDDLKFIAEVKASPT